MESKEGVKVMTERPSSKPDRRRVLFVCTANTHRSRTAEDMFGDDPRYQVRSAGTDVMDSVPEEQPVTEELLRWADLLFVMEDYHRQALQDRFPESSGRVVVLGIEDRYYRGEPELIRLLRRRLSPYLG